MSAFKVLLVCCMAAAFWQGTNGSDCDMVFNGFTDYLVYRLFRQSTTRDLGVMKSGPATLSNVTLHGMHTVKRACSSNITAESINGTVHYTHNTCFSLNSSRIRGNLKIKALLMSYKIPDFVTFDLTQMVVKLGIRFTLLPKKSYELAYFDVTKVSKIKMDAKGAIGNSLDWAFNFLVKNTRLRETVLEKIESELQKVMNEELGEMVMTYL